MTLKEILETPRASTGLPAPRLRLPHAVPLAVAAVDTSSRRSWAGRRASPLESVRMSRHRMFFDAGKGGARAGAPAAPDRGRSRARLAWFRENGYVRG